MSSGQTMGRQWRHITEWRGIVFKPLVAQTRKRDNLQMLSQNCEKRPLASLFMPVRPSVRMQQLGSHLTDFDEI